MSFQNKQGKIQLEIVFVYLVLPHIQHEPVTNSISFQVNHANNKAHFRDFNNPAGI
ncbi:hypothetical protein [Nostoc sp. UHCC 0302]|uniref:hypothetical protein n=1 Tax=Nostoc sp. UHCC 0302 TaxID=3134896 RepID=UPI00311CB468